MSDSLRTKIIESLTGKTIVVSDGYDGYSIIERDAAEEVADAVIRELDAVPQRIMLSHASQAAESNRLVAAAWLERELASVGLECGAGWVLYHLVDGVVARLNGAVDE